MATVKLIFTGVTPLVMHSDRYVDPLDKMTKQHKLLTSKRKKTDEDHEAIARSEYLGALYYDKENGIHIPGANIKSCIVDAAKLNKLGVEVKRSLIVIDETVPLQYEGPKTPDGLLEDSRFVLAKSVVVGQSRLMRHRPRFPAGWKLSVIVEVDDTRINLDELKNIMSNAGRYIGLGDWRPNKGGTYGRFQCEVVS